MRQPLDIKKEFKRQYFWDVDISNLNLEASRRLLIERVFTLGNVKEMRKLIAYYGSDEVVEELREINYLDPKTLNFVSKLFNRPKREFKCYTRNRSNPQHWSS